jgi:hypothetical protein
VLRSRKRLRSRDYNYVQQERCLRFSSLIGLHPVPSIRACAWSTTVLRSLNVRSLLNKFDDIIELCRDRRINLLCLTESWHDADSAVLGRLRCARFNVVHRPRLGTAGNDDMSVNHGGIVVVTAANVVLSPIVIADQPTTFEVVCVRTTVGSFHAVVIVVYRPARWRLNKSSSMNSPPSWISLLVTKSRSTLSVTSTSG